MVDHAAYDLVHIYRIRSGIYGIDPETFVYTGSEPADPWLRRFALTPDTGIVDDAGRTLV